MIVIPIRVRNLGEIAMRQAEAECFLDEYALTHTHEETVDKAHWLLDRLAKRVKFDFGVPVSPN